MTITNISGKKIDNSSKEDLCLRSIGILKRSNELRNNTLQRNIGKYQMYDTPLNPPIGQTYDIYANENVTPNILGSLGLMGYTDNLTINDDGYNGSVRRAIGSYETQFYVPNNNLMDTILEVIGIKDKDYKNKRYDSYVDYIQNVYSNDFTWLNAIQQWLDKSTIKGSLEYSKVGLLRDIDIWASLNGVILTNVNNFSGQDTALGTFSNYMYADTLNWGAYFNTTRNAPYITNDISRYIGLNDTTKTQISSILKNSDFGRVEIPIPSVINDIENSQQLISQYLGNSTKRYLFESLYKNDLRFGPGYNITYVEENIDKGGDTAVPYLNDYTSKSEDGEYKFNLQKQSLVSNNLYATYTEGDKVGSGVQDDLVTSSYLGDVHISIENINGFNNPDTLLYKTNQLFNNRKIASLLGRFHTTVDTSGDDSTESTMTNSAVSKYGVSRGRNLLTKSAEKSYSESDINGYGNPYCRVWTFHHQYDRITRLIRPFKDVDGNGNESVMGIDELQKNWSFSRGAVNQGGKYLAQYTSLDRNGFVNIAPTSLGEVDVKKCMFSIENLAWKGVKLDEALSPDQIGPLGGRIMWFPPYDLNFSENVGVSLESSVFIGRGEPLYTYSNTERTGTLTFKLVVDHPSIINYWEGRNGSNSQSDSENENDLLRFFAGCDVISGVSESTLTSITEVTGDTKTEEVPAPVSEPPKDVVFYVFFPNNYSGIDDVNNQGFNGMDYLFYGVQCSNICSGNNVIPFDPFEISGQEPYGYEMGNHGISLDSTGCPYPAIDGSNGKKWQYRIDDAYTTQLLVTKDGYKDTDSFKLNSTLSIDDGYDDSTHSFAEVYAAINKTKNKDKINQQIEKNNVSTERIDELKNILSNYSISSVDVFGMASSHGNNASNLVNSNRNADLSKDRAESIRYWLNENNIDNVKVGDSITKKVISNSVNSREAKLARCAKVVIHFKNGETKKLSKTQQTVLNEETLKRQRNVAGVNTNVFSENREPFSILSTPVVPYSANEYLSDVDNAEQYIASQTPMETIGNSENGLLSNVTSPSLNIKTNAIGSLRPLNNVTISPDGNRMVSTSSTFIKHNDERYDDESKFFDYLNSQSPLYFKRLSEKIKFFHPAFHSTTPEGFNARLTFLHQCTRQGPTISSSDNKNFAATAANLSFGRPPFCVLRIGDFYNTKIIIDSMSINYEPLWDLNPEGIGIQPMVATINLNFKFVGGSSLAGPIVKLQNAVSFNFFANTPVYDNRSDRVEYGNYKMKEGTYQEWLPTMENKSDVQNRNLSYEIGDELDEDLEIIDA
jgi:hypothetical protein